MKEQYFDNTEQTLNIIVGTWLCFIARLGLFGFRISGPPMDAAHPDGV